MFCFSSDKSPNLLSCRVVFFSIPTWSRVWFRFSLVIFFFTCTPGFLSRLLLLWACCTALSLCSWFLLLLVAVLAGCCCFCCCFCCCYPKGGIIAIPTHDLPKENIVLNLPPPPVHKPVFVCSVLRDTMVNRTRHSHKNLHIPVSSLGTFGYYFYVPVYNYIPASCFFLANTVCGWANVRRVRTHDGPKACIYPYVLHTTFGSDYPGSCRGKKSFYCGVRIVLLRGTIVNRTYGTHKNSRI